MRKLDKIGIVCNIILTILYVPFSGFCLLLMMASDAKVWATNPLYIELIDIFCGITLTIPLFCIIGIALSILFRKKGHSILSFIIQFLPLIIFWLNMIFLTYTESLPKTI